MRHTLIAHVYANLEQSDDVEPMADAPVLVAYTPLSEVSLVAGLVVVLTETLP